jgi:uncharacterized protein
MMMPPEISIEEYKKSGAGLSFGNLLDISVMMIPCTRFERYIMHSGYNCLAVSDLHGRRELYERLFAVIADEAPAAVFIAGDISGGIYKIHLGENVEDFVSIFLRQNLALLKKEMKESYPEIFIILGNDDPGILEPSCLALEKQGLWHYSNNNCRKWREYTICGYSYVPPTPFQLKDWEKYDVSRYVDVGAIPPNAGFRTKEVDDLEMEWGTIKRDLEKLFTSKDLSKYICLFHAPPYKTALDRAGLDGKMIEYAPLDVHIGSIAILQFITCRQPLLTIHGHVHESTSITGSWLDRIGNTTMLNVSHHLLELAITCFDPRYPDKYTRQIFR